MPTQDTLAQAKPIIPIPADTLEKRLKTARQLAKAYRFDAATDTLERLYNQDSTNLEVIRELEDLYYNTSQTTKALDMVDRLLEAGRDSSVYLARKALLLKKEGNAHQAKKLFHQLLKNDSTNTFFLNQLAEIYEAMHMTDSAMICYTQSAVISPRSQTLYKAGQLLLRKDREKDALDFFKEFYHPEKNRERPLRRLYGQTYYLLDSIDKSIEVFGGLYEEGDSSFITTKFLGMSYRKDGDFLAAEIPLRQAARQNVNDFLVYYNLGICCRKLGMVNESEKHLNTAMDIITTPVLVKNMINREMARTYEKQMKWRKAVELYHSILETDPSNLAVRMDALSIMDRQIKDRDMAINGYKKALSFIESDTANYDPRLKKYFNQRIEKLQELKFWEEKKD